MNLVLNTTPPHPKIIGDEVVSIVPCNSSRFSMVIRLREYEVLICELGYESSTHAEYYVEDVKESKNLIYDFIEDLWRDRRV